MNKRRRKIGSVKQARIAQLNLLSDIVRKTLADKLSLSNSSHEEVARAAANLLGIHLDGGLRRARRFLCDMFDTNQLDLIVALTKGQKGEETCRTSE